MGNNEHYVPRWYQRDFSKDKNKVNCVRFNEYGIACEPRSIDSTCSGQYYYGKNSSIDAVLKPLESKQALLFRNIASTEILPARNSDEHLWVVISLLVFLTRTEAARKEYREQFSFTQEINRLPSDGLNHDEIIERAIATYPIITDLNLVLIKAPSTASFVSSDSPVCVVNPLMFDATSEPHIGIASKGIVIVFPLCPTHCLILYDRESYSVDKNVFTSSEACIENLNVFQTLQANEYIFYLDGDGQAEKARLLRLIEKKDRGSHVASTFEDGSTFVYRRIYDHRPELDFISIRDGAKKERARYLKYLEIRRKPRLFGRSSIPPLRKYSEAIQWLVDNQKLKLSDLGKYLA